MSVNDLTAVTERLYSPEELGVSYTAHVILQIQEMGGVRHITKTDTGKVHEIILKHSEDISYAMGTIVAYGDQAYDTLRRAMPTVNMLPVGWFVPKLEGTEVFYEPNSDTVVIHRRFSTTGQALAVVNVKDIIGILRRSP